MTAVCHRTFVLIGTDPMSRPIDYFRYADSVPIRMSQSGLLPVIADDSGVDRHNGVIDTEPQADVPTETRRDSHMPSLVVALPG